MKSDRRYLIPKEKWQRYRPSKPGKLLVGACPNRHWPSSSKLTWHLESEYTQLADAREVVIRRVKSGYRPIRVAHLDMGYPRGGKFKPELFKSGPDFWGKDFDITVDDQHAHGMATMNILAGGQARVTHPPTGTTTRHHIGAAPMVEVISVRVCPEVALFRQSPFSHHRLTHVIDWAIKNEVDVISMSMGGAYSISMNNAVKRARENGIAMFFAAGNHNTLPFISFLRTPDTLVFPAAMSGAMGVAGATATDRTYGYPPRYFSFLEHGLKGWTMRGNWGPSWEMKDNVIAGYSPNITWITPSNKRDHDIVDLDGAGTSSATPQAAAAAALWLQYHREAFTGDQWRSKDKVDAVYRALADTAKKLPKAPKSDSYTLKHFGYGIIQAKDALSITPAEAMKRNVASAIYHEPKIGAWTHRVVRTFGLFSTERAFLSEKDLVPYAKE